jgi:hypothetical protein
MSEEKEDKYAYNRLGSTGQRVGQAVVDILSTSQPDQTVGETLEAASPDFCKEMESCIENNKDKYKSPFYIFVLTKKEPWATNLVRNWIIARQTPPHAFEAMGQWANYTKTLYIVDSHRGNVKLLWSLPAFNECITIAKSPQSFDPDLVRWVEKCFTHELDRDTYSFDVEV